MSLVLQETGERVLLDLLVSPAGQTLLLWQSVSPALGKTTALGDFTEATFAGYARQPLTAWGAAATVAGVTSATHATLTWTPTAGGQVIRGYAVLDLAGRLLWSEAFPAPRTMLAGVPFQVQPRVELD